MINQIQELINKGMAAYQICSALKNQGKRVTCFGSYYTVSSTAGRVCFYETDSGVKCAFVNR